MAKEKRRRFRLKNLKRLLCCCCPFGKKRYTLADCDDGEDDIRGQYTPTWRVTNITPSTTVGENIFGENTPAVPHSEPGEKYKERCVPLQVTNVFREYASLQVIEAQILENYLIHNIHFRRPDHALIQATAIRRWGEAVFHRPCDHTREPSSHTVFSILPVNNKTMTFQNTMNCFAHILDHMYLWSRCIIPYKPNLSTTDVHRSMHKLPRHAPMPVQEMSLMHRHEGDVNPHGLLVIISFLHRLSQGEYYHQRIIQTYRNHCVIKYQIIFVPDYPDVFSFVFGSTFYITTCIHMSYQVLRSLEYQCNDRSINNRDRENTEDNDDEDNKSDGSEDDERDDHDIIKHDADDNACEYKTDNGGSFIKNTSQSKKTGIPKYWDSGLPMDDSNDKVPARSKRNDRVGVKATLPAASDPPPDQLIQTAQIYVCYCNTETYISESPSALSTLHIHHPYFRCTSSLNSNQYQNCIHNINDTICIPFNQHCIGAILAFGFIIYVYFVYCLMHLSDSYC